METWKLDKVTIKQQGKNEKSQSIVPNMILNLDTAYLSSIGGLFTIAFLSYFVQFPGLLSSSGLEPVGRILPFVFPNKYQLLGTSSDEVENWIAVEIICEVVAIVGVLLSSVAAW